MKINVPSQPYEELETLKAFHRSPAKARLIVGPFRSGKSVAAVNELYRMIIEGIKFYRINKFRTICVRKTYRMLKDSVIKTFFEWIPKEAGRYSESDMTFSMPIPEGGFWEVLFRSADTPEDIEKFTGVELTNYWIDEAQEVSQDVKLILDGRLSYPAGADKDVFKSILTTNPCDTEHWIYQTFVENPLPGHAWWRQGARENRFLHAEYYDELERNYRDRPEIKRRYVDGEWGAIFAGKPVYLQEFNYDFHVAKTHIDPLHGSLIQRGWDFGLSPACIFSQVSQTGEWLILRELWSDDMSIDEFGDAVNDYSRQHFRGFTYEDVGDPAGSSRSPTDEKSCMDILAAKNIYVREAPTNQFIPRREAVARRLLRAYKGRPYMLIDPRCRRLIDGFSGGYRYEERGNTGTFSERPNKNQYSHVHDALQYLALDLFGYAEFNPRLWTEPMKQIGVVNA